MGFVTTLFRVSAVLGILGLLAACVAKQDLILPNKQQRITAVDSYKQCVALATNNHVHQNDEPEAIVRASMSKCRPSKYAMLKDYPKGWRENYERKIDDEILKEEIAFIVSARRGRAVR